MPFQKKRMFKKIIESLLTFLFSLQTFTEVKELTILHSNVFMRTFSQK